MILSNLYWTVVEWIEKHTIIYLSTSPPSEGTESKDTRGGRRVEWGFIPETLSTSSDSSNRLLSIHDAWNVSNGSSHSTVFWPFLLSPGLGLFSVLRSDIRDSSGEWQRCFLVVIFCATASCFVSPSWALSSSTSTLSSIENTSETVCHRIMLFF